MASEAYKSEAMAAIHETMEGFYKSGAIDEQTMREFDKACLTSGEAPTRPEGEATTIDPMTISCA